MLNTLTIEQFAIIDASHIEFEPGFNVLSGETGAGKSILIDALSLALGERADASMIRNGADKATIQSTFSPISDSLIQRLQEDGLENSEALSQCLIRRQIRPTGNKVFFNDNAITSKKLKSISESLLSIHGQQANQSLLKPSAQRLRLDRFAKAEPLRTAVGTSYQKWQQAQQAYETWQAARSAEQERLNLLSYQLEELDQCAPKEDEFAQLSSQYTTLSAADEILANAQQLVDVLRENDAASVDHLFAQAKQLLGKLVQIDPRFNEAQTLLEQSAIYIDEAYDAAIKQIKHVEHDPQQLAEIDARMSTLHSLARKHHTDPNALYQHWQTLRQEHARLMSANDDGERLQQHVTELHMIYEQHANKLSKRRQQASKQLGKDVTQWIQQLGMAQADFLVQVTRTEQASEHGMDEVQFLLCANPGQRPQPLQKVASGGELSRVSLAIEVACLDQIPVPTVIFDEIDAGIGGEVADTVGKLLHALSANRQVLCITHLPQVAAYADAHYFISKYVKNGQTHTRVKALDNDERVFEIARMLGDADSKTSQQHAKAMLANKAH